MATPRLRTGSATVGQVTRTARTGAGGVTPTRVRQIRQAPGEGKQQGEQREVSGVAVQTDEVRRKRLIAQDQPGQQKRGDDHHQRQHQALAPGQQGGNAGGRPPDQCPAGRFRRAMRRTTRAAAGSPDRRTVRAKRPTGPPRPGIAGVCRPRRLRGPRPAPAPAPDRSNASRDNERARRDCARCTASRPAHPTSRNGASVTERRPVNPTRLASVRASSQARRPVCAARSSTTNISAYARGYAGYEISANPARDPSKRGT